MKKCNHINRYWCWKVQGIWQLCCPTAYWTWTKHAEMYQNWIFMAPFSSRAIRRGDSWKQKSLMEQRRHQWCKNETLPRAKWHDSVQLTRPYQECMLLNGQRSHQHPRGFPEIMNVKLDLLELAKNLPTSSAFRSLTKWYRKKLPGHFSDRNSIKMYNSTQKNISSERNG